MTGHGHGDFTKTGKGSEQYKKCIQTVYNPNFVTLSDFLLFYFDHRTAPGCTTKYEINFWTYSKCRRHFNVPNEHFFLISIVIIVSVRVPILIDSTMPR